MDTVNPPPRASCRARIARRTLGAPRPRIPAGFGGLNPRQLAVLEEAPTSARGILERAYSGKSKAAGIKAFCLACVGYARQDVRDCTSKGCPLWPYRPFQKNDEADDAE